MWFLKSPSRLICVGLCLAGVSPAGAPTSSVPDGPAAGGAAVAAATRPAKARVAAVVPAEDADQWLRRRLGESGARAADLPAKATQPVRPPRDSPVPVPFRPWLPPPAVAAAPRVARGDREHPLRPRPAVDAQLPPLALDVSPDVPAPIVLPAYVPARISSPDPARVAVASLSGRGNVDRPTAAADPTAQAASPAALAATPPARAKPAPPLLLKIPDPAGPSGNADIPAAADVQEALPATYAGPAPGKPTLSQK